MPNYKVFTYTNEKGLNVVKVGSTYAGKPVWGYAVCAPGDEYDYDYGYTLAKARCDMKIAHKRFNRAKSQLNFHHRLLEAMEETYNNTLDYYEDSYRAKIDAQNTLITFFNRGQENAR